MSGSRYPVNDKIKEIRAALARPGLSPAERERLEERLEEIGEELAEYNMERRGSRW